MHLAAACLQASSGTSKLEHDQQKGARDSRTNTRVLVARLDLFPNDPLWKLPCLTMYCSLRMVWIFQRR